MVTELRQCVLRPQESLPVPDASPSSHLTVPDTPVAVAARTLAEAASPPFLFNHAARTFGLALLFAGVDGIDVEGEFLYVGALLHDLGLTDRFDGPRCFENESAAAAMDFARDQGWDDLRQERLANAIRFHMQPRVAPEDDAAGYLLSEATSCDVRGHRLDELPRDIVADLIGRYPRLGFKEAFVMLFEKQARAKPGCLADLYLQRGWADLVRSAPFAE
jgi:hypothetical protein